MHMADALLSPAVGGAMWAVSAAGVAWCSRRAGEDVDDRAIPLMGVLGAFVFAAQMINFTIPGTGSSGHLGGGLLLAILLGPRAAFLAITSIIVIQALLFADGGLLALGCNLFNIGFLPCFAGYPLYRRLAGKAPSAPRLVGVIVVAAVVSVQLGAMAVVLQTVFSGVSALPLRAFATVMLPVHLAIGLVEGIATALIIGFLRKTRPALWAAAGPAGKTGIGGVLAGFTIAFLLTAGLLSWFASDLPDGLEWSIRQVTGTDELPPPTASMYARLAELQAETAILPDYRLTAGESTGRAFDLPAEAESSLAGVVGGIFTLLLTAGLLCLLRRGCGKG